MEEKIEKGTVVIHKLDKREMIVTAIIPDDSFHIQKGELVKCRFVNSKNGKYEQESFDYAELEAKEC